MKTIVWLGFVLGAVSAAGTVIYTTAQSKVTLDCGVRSFTRGLVWYHGGEMVISIDGRSGMQRRGRTDLTSRVRVKGDTKLEIPYVRQEDAGTFTCEADGTKHEHTLVVVSVSASPTDEPELGTNVTLQCRVNGQNPGSTVQWMRPDGTTATGTESGTVELRSVASSDAGPWKCIINPSGTTVNLDLKVKASAAATVIYTTPQSKITLDCGVKSFTRGLVWYHGGEMVIGIDGRSGFQGRGRTDLTSRVRVRGDTKLEILDVRQEDGGTFSCEADGIIHEHTLAVVSASASPTDEPEQGTNVTLQCRVNGQNPGSTVQWTRPDGTTVAGTESGTVELRSVASSDAGTWKCIINPSGTTVNLDLKVKANPPEPGTRVITAAGTESGTVKRQSVASSDAGTLKIMIKPGGKSVKLKLTVEVLDATSAAGTVIYTTPHSNVILDCGVGSFARGLVWYHGGEMVLAIDGRSGFQHRGRTDLSSRVRVKGNTNLEILYVRQEDAGTFSCEADGIRHEHTLVVFSGQRHI